jgi:hypothetical protein
VSKETKEKGMNIKLHFVCYGINTVKAFKCKHDATEAASLMQPWVINGTVVNPQVVEMDGCIQNGWGYGLYNDRVVAEAPIEN